MDAPLLKTALPGPKAAALIARDSKHVSPSYTRDYPLVMAGGSGAVVEDVDGNLFLDCAAGIAVNATGINHPDVVKAIVDQAQRFLHMSGTDFYYEPQVKLAEDMADIVPISGEVKTFFGNSGTEAVEASVKLAKYHTKRFGIIAFLGSFHGRSMGSLSLTSSKTTQRRGFGPLLPGVYHAPYATCYRCPVGLEARHVSGRVPGLCRGPDAGPPDLARRSRRHRRRGHPGRRRVSRAAAAVPPAAAGPDRRSTGCCWWPTKCSRAWAGRGRCSRWSTSASSRTSSRRPRASPRACRWACAARAPT